jgi:conjugative relaxase-like TrwC/TraI family protein
MLRITPMGASAKSYLRDGLSKADYYTNGEPILETWKGDLTSELGLENRRATIETFDMLCDNINPKTGQMLSAKNVENRKAYYDFTFSAPKSVSILHGLTNDSELKNGLENVMRQSVIEAMNFAQKEFSLTRDKTNNQNRYLKTGKLIYTEFLHDTSRPINGIPDPHLHIHAAVFNITKDPETGVLKSMEFHDFAKYRNQIEAVHHSVLASKLQSVLGLELRATNNSFELVGIDRNLIDQFSNATKKIEKFAEDKGITSSTIKGNLGAKLREKKTDKLPQNELTGIWLDRLDFDSQKAVQSFRISKPIIPLVESLNNTAIQDSIKHNFERSTVVDKRNLITYAFNSDLTKLDYKDVIQEYQKVKDNFEIVDTTRGRQEFLTTKAVLEEEKKIKDFVNSGINQTKPINPNFKLTNSMSIDQDRVFYSVLNSKDSIQYIRGDAGAGKTYLIQNLKQAMEESNHSVFAYAPTSIARRKVLREEVSKDSNTIASLINNPAEQEKLNSKSVVFIDEAGMVSYKDMIKLLELRQSKSFRMILVGDTKQHASVVRGDTLRFIETNTNINTFALTDNRRQSDPEYKKAIYQLANKDITNAIQTLDNIGAIKEIPLSTKRYEAISKEYITKVKEYRSWQEAQKEVLIVTPTHEEASIITTKVRRELKKNGFIDTVDTPYKTLKDRGLTTRVMLFYLIKMW